MWLESQWKGSVQTDNVKFRTSNTIRQFAICNENLIWEQTTPVYRSKWSKQWKTNLTHIRYPKTFVNGIVRFSRVTPATQVMEFCLLMENMRSAQIRRDVNKSVICSLCYPTYKYFVHFGVGGWGGGEQGEERLFLFGSLDFVWIMACQTKMCSLSWKAR